MATRLSDKQKKKVIADYIELGSYNAAAKKNGISNKTAKAIVCADPEFAQMSQQKKDKNAMDIIDYMDTKKNMACQIIDRYLTEMLDEQKIKHATVLQLATTMGIIIDKFTASTQNEQAIKKLDELMDKIGGGI
jgi:hypothetical protein